MNDFTYRLVFAVVNWIEATAILLTLGRWSPCWVMNFACWCALRKHNKRCSE